MDGNYAGLQLHNAEILSCKLCCYVRVYVIEELFKQAEAEAEEDDEVVLVAVPTAELQAAR